jgi:hypothetical protein
MKPANPLKRFPATVHRILGSTPRTLNPCVDVPEAIAVKLQAEARKNQSLPVRASVKGEPFKAHVVRYRGAWRLYLNTPVRKRAGIVVGERVDVSLRFDPVRRRQSMPPAFARALAGNPRAKAAFAGLAPYRRKEILRYLGALKQAETLKRNIERTLRHLTGKTKPGRATAVFLRERAKRS